MAKTVLAATKVDLNKADHRLIYQRSKINSKMAVLIVLKIYPTRESHYEKKEEDDVHDSIIHSKRVDYDRNYILV